MGKPGMPEMMGIAGSKGLTESALGADPAG